MLIVIKCKTFNSLWIVSRNRIRQHFCIEKSHRARMFCSECDEFIMSPMCKCVHVYTMCIHSSQSHTKHAVVKSLYFSASAAVAVAVVTHCASSTNTPATDCDNDNDDERLGVHAIYERDVNTRFACTKSNMGGVDGVVVVVVVVVSETSSMSFV